MSGRWVQIVPKEPRLTDEERAQAYVKEYADECLQQEAEIALLALMAAVREDCATVAERGLITLRGEDGPDEVVCAVNDEIRAIAQAIRTGP